MWNLLRHQCDMKQIYALLKETIERICADAKEKHGMRWTTLIVHDCHEFKEAS
ncbi:hypothetical protein [Lysinibacillus sphaericus]|uniref:Transposase n=1 Tax=Lysinibacillus sphaericus OT4b.31 TaxID=1285586 RepID=R7ZDS7_LYSSH|nr:hypothetical protein [Lysinibacillus sphaericus]EON72146.1 transposase [Lysinibacillus sphaericus OT4b.31]